MRILSLPIKRVHFDEIASGKKKIEYRIVKDHWIKRLGDSNGLIRHFDEVHFRNGYREDSPFMRVKHKYTTIGYVRYPVTNTVERCFFIHIGDILEVNYN